MYTIVYQINVKNMNKCYWIFTGIKNQVIAANTLMSDTFTMDQTHRSLNFISKVLKFTGFLFSTHEFKRSEISYKVKIVDMILFLVSSTVSFGIGLFVRYGVDLDKILDSIVIKILINKFGNITFTWHLPMKVSHFFMAKKFYSIFNDLRVCAEIVRIIIQK